MRNLQTIIEYRSSRIEWIYWKANCLWTFKYDSEYLEYLDTTCMISVHIYHHGKSLISVFISIKICVATNSWYITMSNQTSTRQMKLFNQLEALR